uniref:Mitogen-activated protein kinase 2 n=2 Tax=Tetraselmis sp. GSL018 TaxID=582737 RepID=A0A061SNS9_9CHLO|eukprot:CAMPEP_0177578368 /NCGR_PEP_ID=MMETSP0419_2-20121207/309_1 /TAXON_ID=582737 /ORGANISM="Tetraselmis sp., Strain GSL018" /LENGTH=680 /DNA_ID=CAMNT_0019066803 /DNA_START=1047 /DNA_END=3089 /DNA_ORIENTATION=-
MATIKESPYEPGCYFVGDQQWKVPPRYKLLKVLGRGSFSFVCLAEDTEANEQVAIKIIPDLTSSADYIKRVLREVCILRRISHPGIIELKGAFVQPSSTGPKRCIGGKLVATSIDLYMVMEYVDGGDLFSLKGQMSEMDVKSLLLQLLLAVQYLHSINVWHRDLKSANVLLTYRDGARLIKICDFGSARSKNIQTDCMSPELGKRRRLHNSHSYVADVSASDLVVKGGSGGMQSPLTRTVATPCYRAPEVIMSRGSYSSAIDMWSVGCIFGELLQRVVHTGGNFNPSLQVAPLFSVTWSIPLTPEPGMRFSDSGANNAATRRELETLFDVVGTPAWRCIENVPSQEWRAYLRRLPGRAPKLHRRFRNAGEEALDLLARLLTFEPSRRASSEEAMCHEYLSDIIDMDAPPERNLSRDVLVSHGSSQPMDIPGAVPMDSDVRESKSLPAETGPFGGTSSASSTPPSFDCLSPMDSSVAPISSQQVLRQLSNISLAREQSRHPDDSTVSLGEPSSNHWEELNPARALELLELSIEEICCKDSEQEQCQGLRDMLEAEVAAIQAHGTARRCHAYRMPQRIKHKLPRTFSLSEVRSNALLADAGGNIDSSVVGRARLGHSADITAAKLNAEEHLGSRRHGEWAGHSGRRDSRSSGWGSQTLPPGTPPNSAMAAAYLKAISAQQAR